MMEYEQVVPLFSGFCSSGVTPLDEQPKQKKRKQKKREPVGFYQRRKPVNKKGKQ